MILNSQPFGVLHDNNVEQILTPNDLLFGRKLNEGNVSAKFDTNKLTDLNTQLKHINNLINHLWNRWHSVYMPLQIPKKVHQKTNSIIPGVGYAVNEENHSILRPINKLYLLEFQGEFKIKSNNDNINDSRPTGQQAAIIAHLKRKYTS